MAAIPAKTPDLTALLEAWRGGDRAALDEVVERVHAELRRIARGCLRGERANHSLQVTALVNEAFVRLVDVERIDWQNRIHFLAVAARIMRRVLVDLARARQADKRGGGAIHVTFDETLFAGQAIGMKVIELDDALEALAALDERKSQVVQLRFFGGLSVEETAGVLQVSSKTVARDWDFACAWLQRQMARR